MAAAILAGAAFATVPMFPLITAGLWLAGAVLVQLRLLANLLDGMVAIGRGLASPLSETAKGRAGLNAVSARCEEAVRRLA